MHGGQNPDREFTSNALPWVAQQALLALYGVAAGSYLITFSL
jgi:hypothetical protein